MPRLKRLKRLKRPQVPFGGRSLQIGGQRIIVSKKKPPPEFIATVGPRTIVAQTDDIISIQYLVSVDAGSDPATTMTIELKRADTSAVVSSQSVAPIAPGAFQTITFIGIDAIDGPTPLDFKVCVVTDIGTIEGAEESMFAFLLDFDSTATGAINPSIVTAASVTIPIYTIDSGATWDISALPGGVSTVDVYIEAGSNTLSIDFSNLDLDLNSTPFAEIASTNTPTFTAQGNAIIPADIVAWVSDFAANPYGLLADFTSNTNQWVAAADPGWPADLTLIQGASGDVLIGQGVVVTVATGLTGNNKWVGDPHYLNGSLFFAPQNADDILELDLTDASISTHATGETAGDRWTGGFISENGKLYTAPSASANFLEFTEATSTVRLIASGLGTANKFNSEAINVGGDLYWTPSSANNIAKYVESTDTLSFVALGSTGNQAWNGTPVQVGDKLYFTPRNSDDILEYDFVLDAVRFIPTGLTGNFKYHSGTYYAPTDQVIFTPRNANDIMIYNVTADTVQFVATGETGNDKWSGPGTLIGSDIYFVPVDNDNILKLDIPGLTTTLISSTVLGQTGKWECGFQLAGSLMYATPRTNDNILVLNPSTDVVSLIATGQTGANKWDGRPDLSGSVLFFTPRDNNNVLVYPI